MSATFNKIQDFVNQLAQGKHLMNSDTWKCVLIPAANTPANTNTILSNWTQIASGNGYTTDGADATRSLAYATGTVTVSGTSITWTGGAAAMAAFQFVGLYNATTGAPVKPLIGWWDYGSAVTLNPGETFTAKFNGTAGAGGTICTLT